MAELEENLGQLSSTLDRLVNEVAGLRTELADLKKINTSVLKKQLVRKGAEKEIHYLWWDKKQGQANHEDVFTWPSSNCSSRPNHVFQNQTTILSHYQNVDWPYQVGDIQNFEPDGVHKNKNNLYFLEPQYVFSDQWESCVDYIPQEVVCWLRERKMALVLWFPHEGFNFEQGYNHIGWLQMFHEQMRKHQLENIICYFVFGDLQAAPNYDTFLRTRQGNERTQFEFTKVISYDYFHQDYWREYSERTGIYVNRLQNPKYMHQNTYGDSQLTGGFTDHVIIPYEDFNAELLGREPNSIVQDSYERCKPDEVLVGIPNGIDKTKDLICLNARPRSHRPVLVSELHRIGYNNENSYVSFLGREDMLNQHGELITGQPIWKQQMFRDLNITQFTARKDNPFISFLSHDVQIEYTYRFWKDRNMVLADRSVMEVHGDDRLITSQMYKDTFFSLVSETLFGEDKESLFVTEKTFKAIAYRHPFMIVGNMGTLRHLRFLGYETFPEMFDESYDQEYDPKKRFSIILRNLEQWYQLSREEKIKKYDSVKEKLKHNFELFKNSRSQFEKDTTHVLSQLSSHSVDIL